MFNWAENFVYSTENVHNVASIEQVQEVLRSHDRVKVLGTRHCFNSIADSYHNFLTLSTMQEMSLDAEAQTVTVGAGVTYGQLGPYLDHGGFALHNMASLPHTSVVGACSTATHGSGETLGNLSSAVARLEMVTASSDLIRLTRESPEFYGCVVGLGALGVVTSITLDVEPTYSVRQYVYEDLPFREMTDHFDEIQASGYSVSLFTDWQKERINELWIKCRGEFDAPELLFGAKLARKHLHPIGEISAENCTEQMGVEGPWYDRLPHFRLGFMPSAGKELQTEYFVPRRNGVEAILAVERLRDLIGPHLLITEIRTISADELWMSPCYRQDSVAIHFTWKPDWGSVRKVLPAIERELAVIGARPHWGKLFLAAPQYEKGEEFRRLAKQLDPNGKFRNEFLDRNVFA